MDCLNLVFLICQWTIKVLLWLQPPDHRLPPPTQWTQISNCARYSARPVPTCVRLKEDTARCLWTQDQITRSIPAVSEVKSSPIRDEPQPDSRGESSPMNRKSFWGRAFKITTSRAFQDGSPWIRSLSVFLQPVKGWMLGPWRQNREMENTCSKLLFRLRKGLIAAALTRWYAKK